MHTSIESRAHTRSGGRVYVVEKKFLHWKMCHKIRGHWRRDGLGIGIWHIIALSLSTISMRDCLCVSVYSLLGYFPHHPLPIYVQARYVLTSTIIQAVGYLDECIFDVVRWKRQSDGACIRVCIAAHVPKWNWRGRELMAFFAKYYYRMKHSGFGWVWVMIDTYNSFERRM